MGFRIFFVSAMTILCAAGTAYAADTLSLKNGDQLTGTISSYNEHYVRINTNYGPLRIPANDVAAINTAKPAIQNGVQNAISNATAPKQVIPSLTSLYPDPSTAPPAALETVQIVSAPETEPEEDKFWGADWSGNVNVGGNMKRGNSETESYSADAEIKARWEKHRGIIEGEYNFEEDDGNTTVDNRSLRFGHDYFFAEKWFMGNKLSFEQDDIDQIDLRTIASIGLGYQPYERDDLNLKMVLGPGYIHEKFENGDTDEGLTTNWALDYDQKFYDDLFRIFHNHDLTVPTEDTDAYLFTSESGIRVPIKKGIIASGQVDFDWDNDPAPGTAEDDTTYSVKLGYEW